MASEAVNTPVPPGEERFRRLAPPTPASPSDPAFARWTRSLALLTGLGLSEDESEALKEQKLMRRCEKWRDSTVENSPIVRFMLQHVGALPVPPPPRPSPGSPSPTPLSEPNPTRYLPLPILCSPCRPYPSAGMFSRELSPETGGAIRLCGDYLRTKTKVEDTLAHELVHAWDWRKFEVDNTDPRAVACTEIRAAMLSPDCRYTRELDRHHFAFTGQREACARRRAILSVRGYAGMGEPGVAEKAVDEVWKSCSRDTRPFDEIY